MSWRALAALTVVVSVCAFPRNSCRSKTPTQIINKIISEGYPTELHNVTTGDGYILSVYRIPYGKNGRSEEQRPVVFVMHGLMGSSSNFIFLGANYSIAYNLADAGYDVWLGNARGNVNSRVHVSLDPDDFVEKHNFFGFSWEEIGMIDVPAMIDYALAQAGQEKLHYIGHSQGGTAFLVLNSMKPEYNKKFLSAHLLAGVGYMLNFPNAQLKALACFTNTIYNIATLLGMVEVSSPIDLPISYQGQSNRAFDYSSEEVNKAFHDMIGYSILDDVEEGIGYGGAALKQFAHYGQNIKDKAFRRWDHGFLTNRKVYGTSTPPSYNLSRITVDVTMHYTVSDTFLDERDVLAMAAVMPNTSVRKVARESFSHVDFIQSEDVKELVTNHIIETFNQVEYVKTSE